MKDQSDLLERKLDTLDPKDRDNLLRLRSRLKSAEVTPDAVGGVLPEAVLIGEAENRRLSKSMVEVTERSIETSVLKDPTVLSTALFPIIGSAIRKAINKLLADTVANMNAGLENTVSFRRLAWRFESWRTGVPFLEIVLRNTLRYRVEHVFLIHRKTGILLRGLSLEGSRTADDDMVASMLTAVKDYIRDSLSLPQAEAVEGISAGEHSLLAEEGPRASMAVIVRGAPDGGLRTAMQDALESIHLRLSRELESFSGDTAPFEACDPYLRSCLISQEKSEGRAKPVYAIVLLSVLAAAVLGAGVFGAVAQSRRVAFARALSREPGMMVASSRNRLGKMELRLLRDPRAKDVAALAAERGVSLDEFELEVEEFVSPLFGAAAAAPERKVPEELLALARRLAEYTLLFEQDSGDLRSGQEDAVREAGSLIAALADKAKAAGFGVSVEITGHSAGKVQDDSSISVSEERAAKAMSLFAALNAPLVKYVGIRGVGVSEPVVAEEVTEEDRIKNRSVTFKTIFR